MIEFKKYITESQRYSDMSEKNPEEFIELIGKNCNKYIKLLGGRKPLYRGIEYRNNKSIIGVRGVRKNRVPLGSRKETFEFVNKWLDKKKWPRRDKSMICTSDKLKSSSFGDSHIVFPMYDKWSYAWIKSSDFNDSDFFTGPSGWDVDDLDDLLHLKEYEASENLLSQFVFGNKGFSYAYSKEYEIWFDCDTYYYINVGILGNGINLFKDFFKKIGVTV